MRQLHALDAWNAFRRQRERHLQGPQLSRTESVLARIELESMRRTQAAVLARVAEALSGAVESPMTLAPSVVIAHHNGWFAARLLCTLTHEGIRVLECTNNGATALGIVIAEQPDCVIVSDQLVMLSGEQLLAQTESYSPLTSRVLHAEATRLAPQAGNLVLGSQLRPDPVADALLQRTQLSPAS